MVQAETASVHCASTVCVQVCRCVHLHLYLDEKLQTTGSYCDLMLEGLKQNSVHVLESALSPVQSVILCPLPLSELRFNDCRLLEKWSDKEESLQQLVAGLKTMPSLRTLSLAQNRLGKHILPFP